MSKEEKRARGQGASIFYFNAKTAKIDLAEKIVPYNFEKLKKQ
jgi:hypothetical protein